jgi:hypothetical protein
MPLWNLNDRGLRRTLAVEVGGEFVPQETCLTPDDAVFAGVETGGPLKNLYSNLLFCRVFGSLANSARGYVKQKIA